MYLHRVNRGNNEESIDTIICMKRDEFIFFVSEGIKMLSEKRKDSGLPYLKDDVGVGYFNFSIQDEKEYYEVLRGSEESEQ